MGKRLMVLMLLLTGALALRSQGAFGGDTLMPYKMRATYYSDKFVGRKTSSGEVFKQDRYTAAHKTIKMGTLLLVTNPANGKQVIVKVNDRCPKVGVLDLSKKAARSIGVSSSTVTVQVLPERFVTYWERQDEMKDLFENGDFMAFAGTLPVNKTVPLPVDNKNSSLLMPPPPLALDNGEDERVDEQVAVPGIKPSAPNTKTPSDKAQTDKAKADNVKTGNAENERAEKKKDPNAIYNLVLTEVNFRSDAQKAIDNLPLQYQEMAEIVVGPHSAKVRVRLNLAMKENRVVEVQQQLRSLFPKSFLEETE